ncbi:hypothetical protein AYI69_g9808, partial [Smittium culicis]
MSEPQSNKETEITELRNQLIQGESQFQSAAEEHQEVLAKLEAESKKNNELILITVSHYFVFYLSNSIARCVIQQLAISTVHWPSQYFRILAADWRNIILLSRECGAVSGFVGPKSSNVCSCLSSVAILVIPRYSVAYSSNFLCYS